MNVIEINTYKKGKKEIKTYSAPSNWMGLNMSQLLFICKCINEVSESSKTEIKIALGLYKMPRSVFDIIGDENRYAIIQTIKFISEERSFDRNLLPSFWFRFRKYYGPNEEYDNIQGLEFAYAEALYVKYKKEKNDEYLNELAALLYRPRRYFNIQNDIRADFYIYSANKRAKLFASLPFEYKFAIFLNYEAFRNWLINRYDVIFPKVEAEAENEQSEPQQYNTSLWTNAYRMIAESGVFGDYDKVCKQSVLVLFTQLTDKILESQRQKEELDKHRNG